MEDRRATIDRLNSLVARLRAEYAGDPNVRTVGWGLKRSAGDLRDELAVIFYVRAKLPSERSIGATGSRPIPAEIEGFPTDVEAARPGVEAAGSRDDEQYDPLVGGPASSNAEAHMFWFNGHGTLGLLVRDAADSAPMALSNWHVWADGGDEGDDIIQPGHPTAGGHLEGLGKVLACGPLLTSVIEWEAPSPLAGILYGGAAAAAVAAAASDVRDPVRRGQDATVPDPGAVTEAEVVDMAIEYPDLPLPGRPFRTRVRWNYERHTDAGVLHHSVEEERVNTQFLLGKSVVTDRATYRPGEVASITASIWDYQPRPCDAYHVVAHLLPHRRPDQALRLVLHPTACPDAPDGEEGQTCLRFEQSQVGEHPSSGHFDWLTYLSTGQEPVHVVTWFQDTPALQLPRQPLRLSHAPTDLIRARVASGTGQAVTLTAVDGAGQPIGHESTPPDSQDDHVLEIAGEGIAGAVLRGGGGEGLLVEYCVGRPTGPEVSAPVSENLARGIGQELTRLDLADRRLRGRRCCFTGRIRLPATELPDRWDVHLVVQNINHVPDGTEPEEAATVIGGHVLSQHAAPAVVGCTVVMLLDHVFDVI